MKKAALRGSVTLVQEVQLVPGHSRGRGPGLTLLPALRLLLMLTIGQTQLVDRGLESLGDPDCGPQDAEHQRRIESGYVFVGGGGGRKNNLCKESVRTSRFLATGSVWLVVPITQMGEKE